MRANDSGNALFYILIAIALLAALTAAIARSGRMSLTSLSEDRQKLLATGIVDYADSVSKAVSQLRLRGSQFSELRFAAAGLDSGYGVPGAAADDEIFNPAGGAIVYKSASTDALTSVGSWTFTAENEIENVGTTCGVASCSDLLMLLRPVVREICLKINDIVHVDNPSGKPPEDADIATGTLFAGTAGYSKTIGDEAGSAALAGKTAGCFKETASGEYFFYQVLSPF